MHSFRSSHTYEESPVSDGKMDISEATTSQESAGGSPTIENSTNKLETSTTTTSTTDNVTTITNSKLLQSNITQGTTGNIDKLSTTPLDENLKLNNHCLDNDPSSRVLRLGHNDNRHLNMNTNTHRSELTIANSHPLMSSPDSDTDNVHRNVFSFPDVVPESEPLRLASPQPSRPKNRNAAQKPPKQLNLNPTSLCTVSQRKKFSSLREPSPDLVSSGSEQDLSQYQASVEPNYQSVALISNNINRNLKMPSPKPLNRRKIPLSADILSDDLSSLDSISNHSFDDDAEHNLASLSPSSSVLDGLNDRDDDFLDPDTPTNLPPDPIPQYTAEEERRDSRNWQKITLPDGRTREIDMKVIEPYKRVLSHGGYLKAGGHNAIVMFCACHLPDRSRTDYHYVMDNLFLYVVKTLEQLVTEDYVLIYLHGGSSRRNVPPFPWLKKCYQLIDRRLRKSLRNLYLVHPTFWLKSIVWMSRPFVSSKFWRKLIYVRTLEELYSLVPVEKAAIPDKVKNYDSKYT